MSKVFQVIKEFERIQKEEGWHDNPFDKPPQNRVLDITHNTDRSNPEDKTVDPNAI